MQDAIIIGGGITGLTTGYLLQQKGLEISVVEKSLRPGGPIQSVNHNGYLIEKGPNSLLVSDPWIDSLIQELGLRDDISKVSPDAKKRYIARNGKPVSVPSGPFELIGSPLFSFRGKLSLLAEPFKKPLSGDKSNFETVSEFVKRRLGQEILDYAVDPFVGGIYAGDPDELILKDAFPILWELERNHGSLLKGMRSKRKDHSSGSIPNRSQSLNFNEGLHTLPKAIAKKLGNRLWLGSQGVAINRNDRGWQVTWKREGENFEGFAKRLFVCIPSKDVRKLAWPYPISDWISGCPELPYPTVHSLTLGYRREQIQHPLDGFGILVPKREPATILGAIFNSSVYPERAPEDQRLITVMLGGRRDPQLADSDEEELVDIARSDLKYLLGITGAPSFQYLTTWKQAIPQYTSAFVQWKSCIQTLETDYPGLRFGGNSVDGIALSSSLLSAKRLSEIID